MEEKKLYFGDLVTAQGFDSGTVNIERGELMDYVVTGPENKNAFLILSIYDKDGKAIDTHVATRDEVEALGKEKVGLEEYATYRGTFKERGKQSNMDEIRSFLDELAPAVRGDENSVQTKEEADIANDTSLIQQIQGIYKEDGNCMGVSNKKLKAIELIPVFKDGQVTEQPVVYTTWTCAGGRHLLPNTYIWTEKNMLVCSTAYVQTDLYKKFVYEHVQKSSKMSFGLGLSFGSPTGMGRGGPKIDKPVYSNGNSIGANFNFEYCKTWSKLRIEAEYRLKEEIAGIECKSYPR